jgi:hypothetical protein
MFSGFSPSATMLLYYALLRYDVGYAVARGQQAG